MDERWSRWREDALRLPGRRQGKRYPASMRSAAVELVKEALSRGVSEHAACRRLGVPTITFQGWRRRQSSLVAVRVVHEARPTLRMHLGAAFIDLSVEQLVDVLRAAR